MKSCLKVGYVRRVGGRSPHGERGLKYVVDDAAPACPGRSPHGERGLKFDVEGAREAALGGRSPHGERGLK